MEHRGTQEMWADCNTNPLQGAGFKLFRSKVMGIPEDYDDDAEKVRIHSLLLPKPTAGLPITYKLGPRWDDVIT